MSVPQECTVLIVGGGPAGSYAASVLAREGISTVMLEASTFPRYHIGESLLPSSGEFLRFIDAYDKVENHGFIHKDGASFTYNSKPAVYTNFLQHGGHAWNVTRSEFDNILFQHAQECGARVFDGVKVNALHFEPSNQKNRDDRKAPTLERPVSASWTDQSKASGIIRFKYVVDATGRAGLVSTKYMKNRRYNEGLRNIATWGYFEGAGTYGVGTPGEGDPFFPRLQDASGWAWFIPLDNNITSVGLVMQHTSLTSKKKQMDSPNTRDFFLKHLKNDAPEISQLLEKAELKSEVRSASDYSHSASCYASPYLRVIGDAGCFIDPLFSSGVHLAFTGGLSAAATICASIKGDCSEQEAVAWHSQKIHEAYTRFLLAVACAYAQVTGQENPVLTDHDEPNFDRAFMHFRPIIQGAIEMGGEKLTQDEVAESVEFCVQVIQKVEGETDIGQTERKICQNDYNHLVRKNIEKEEINAGIGRFGADVVNGMAVNLTRRALGLVRIEG